MGEASDRKELSRKRKGCKRLNLRYASFKINHSSSMMIQDLYNLCMKNAKNYSKD